MYKKLSGILIHPTSFPSPYGCGDLGNGAYKLIDWLKKSGQKILQILPLGPTGFGDSPYQSFSSFAGTPYIISFDKLIEKNLLTKNDLTDYPVTYTNKVDYYSLYLNNFKILKIAYKNFNKQTDNKEFFLFCNKNKEWLNDYSLFMAIKDSYNGASWDCWDNDLKLHKNLLDVSPEITENAKFYKFIQWQFFSQWKEFKKYANDNGILIIGDAPIFVSYDSADAWSNQDLFYLDKNGKPEIVAGVPPDYFSQTGQLWGNPHYRWNVMKKNGYKWWRSRIEFLLKNVDCLRIDHFRGFESYWEIKYGEPTAQNGRWVKGPGKDFFNSLKKEIGDNINELIIAEDLGVITKEVRKLKNYFLFPGMRIFQFASFCKGTFTDDEGNILDNSLHPYLPENYIENCVAYPGTHDNDTLQGWFNSLDKNTQNDILKYLDISSVDELNYSVIKKLLASNAKWVIFTLQDVLNLPSECRMNTPGTCGNHNWSWRVNENMLTEEISTKLHKLSKENGRA